MTIEPTPFQSLIQKHRADLIGIGVILILTGLVAWQRLWFWNGLGYLDITTFYMPWYHMLGEHIRQFDIPGWNPNQFSGTPLAADPQSGWWYFPAMLSFALLPAIPAYKALLIIHLLLAGISTLIYARMIGLRPIAALVAAVAYEFGPLVNHISCCLIHVQLAVWFPLAFIGTELAARRTTPREQLAGCAITAFAVSQMLAGWVGQGAYNGLLVVGGYVVFRFLFPGSPQPWRDRIQRGIVVGFMSFSLALGIAAAGLWPRLDLIRDTTVSGGNYVGPGSENYAAGWIFPELIDKLLSDGANYFTYLYYLGAATVTLAFLAVPIVRAKFRAPFFLGLTAITTIMTLEQITPIHRALYLLPRFETLHEHVPMRIVAVQWIGPAMLAGIAVEGLLSRNWKRSPWWIAAIAGVPWMASVVYLNRHDRVIGLAMLIAAGAIATIATLLGTKRIVDRPRWQAALAILVVVLVFWEPAGRDSIRGVFFDGHDPALEIRATTVTDQDIEINAATTDPGGAGEFLQQQIASEGPIRFFGYDDLLQFPIYDWPSSYREWYFAPEAQDLLINARAMMLDLYDVQGYNPVQISQYVQLLDALNGMQQNYHDAQVLPSGLNSPVIDLLGVRYIVVPRDVPPGRPDLLRLSQLYPTVFSNDSIRVLENPNALPRAWIVHEVQSMDEGSQGTAIASGENNPATTALLETDELPELTAPSDATAESVTITDYQADQISISATASASGLVILSDVYARGWTATVNGKSAKLYEVDGGLRGVRVEAGTNEIVMTYDPASLKYGFWISIVTMVGIVVALVFLRRSGMKHGT
ncbi:hypothetical protein BH09CHL1_BH09CHL1_31100 [soil metagenome]